MRRHRLLSAAQRRLLRGGAAMSTMALLLGGTTASEGSSFTTAATIAWTSALPGSFSACTAKCSRCAFWTAVEVDPSLPGFGTHWDDYFDCADVDCPNGCQATSLEPKDAVFVASSTSVEGVWRTAAVGNTEELSRLIRDHENVQVNVARNALQVTGCNGEVVAHIPLSADQIRLLAD